MCSMLESQHIISTRRHYLHWNFVWPNFDSRTTTHYLSDYNLSIQPLRNSALVCHTMNPSTFKANYGMLLIDVLPKLVCLISLLLSRTRRGRLGNGLKKRLPLCIKGRLLPFTLHFVKCSWARIGQFRRPLYGNTKLLQNLWHIQILRKVSMPY